MSATPAVTCSAGNRSTAASVSIEMTAPMEKKIERVARSRGRASRRHGIPGRAPAADLTAGAARRTLTRPTVKRRLRQLTGIAFIAFGLRLALGD